MTQESVRPAFYALRGGGWRDYVTLLHAPYTLWNLSYVALGAGLAPQFHLDRMLWAMAAFFLALGVAAHALDELNGRPLQTRIPSAGAGRRSPSLSLGGALAIGIGAAIAWGYGLLVFVAIGGVAVPVYNLELLGGVIHNELGLALSWGGLTVLCELLGRGPDAAGRRDPGRRLRHGADRRPAHALDARPRGPAQARRPGERRAAGASAPPARRSANIVLGAAVVAARLALATLGP